MGQDPRTEVENRHKLKSDGKSASLKKKKDDRFLSSENDGTVPNLYNIKQGDDEPSTNNYGDTEKQSSEYGGENRSPSLKQQGKQYIPPLRKVEEKKADNNEYWWRPSPATV